jgi:hypothetical protein
MKILALMGAAAVLMAAQPASAQSSLREFGRGPMAPLAGAMTEAQARTACTRELRGTSNKRIPRDTMQICMQRKMFGPA